MSETQATHATHATHAPKPHGEPIEAAKSDPGSVNVTAVDERDAKIAELQHTVKEMEAAKAERDAKDAALEEQFDAMLAVPQVALSLEEMAMVIASMRTGLVHNGGSVCRKVDGGVYCQFSRPGHDGSFHCYVRVPDAFPLITFVPASEE